VIVHDVTGLLMRLLMGAVLDARKRGVLTPEGTPDLWEHVEAILDWCASPGDETA
jgi:hypothetical protein